MTWSETGVYVDYTPFLDNPPVFLANKPGITFPYKWPTNTTRVTEQESTVIECSHCQRSKQVDYFHYWAIRWTIYLSIIVTPEWVFPAKPGVQTNFYS